MKIIKIQHHKTKNGELILGSFNNQIVLVDFLYRKMRSRVDSRIQNGLNAIFKIQKCEILDKTKEQISEYFSGERKQFDLPVLTVGTDFQKLVWSELLKIKYGETISYLGLAERIGNKKAVRAVANANGANSIGFIIPCHRVIETNGGIGGYGGGVLLKKRLLEMENSLF
ncbi:MAG: methylated-DNA--[protein]-cysteine S-methyltransferase [Alphaproteobacteria bacterium]